MKNAKGVHANMNTFCRSAAFKLGYADYIAGRAMREQWDLDKVPDKQGRAAWRYIDPEVETLQTITDVPWFHIE